MNTKPVLLVSLLYLASNLSAYPNINEPDVIRQFAQRRILSIEDSLNAHSHNPYTNKESPAERSMSIEKDILHCLLDSKNIDHARLHNKTIFPADKSANEDEKNIRNRAHERVEYLLRNVEIHIREIEIGEQLTEEIDQEINHSDL